MITVIKHGKETFTVTCPVCGCVFTYHVEDLNEDCFQNHYVMCPDCQHHVSHDEPKKKGIPNGNDPITWNKSLEDYMKHPSIIPIPDIKLYGDYNSCEGCLYYEQQKRNPEMVPVVGDTPCTWCKERVPYCVNAVGTTPKCLTSPEDIDLPQ